MNGVVFTCSVVDPDIRYATARFHIQVGQMRHIHINLAGRQLRGAVGGQL